MAVATTEILLVDSVAIRELIAHCSVAVLEYEGYSVMTRVFI